MRKGHKILISIGIVFAVAVTAGGVFQVNKTIAYNKQQQEIKIAQEKKVEFDKLEAEKLAKQLEAEPTEKKAVDQAWDLISSNFNNKSSDTQYLKDARDLVKDYPAFISKYKEDAHAIYVYSQIRPLVSKYWAGVTRENSFNASGKYDDYESYSRNFEASNKLTVASLIKDLNPNEMGSGSPDMSSVMSNLKSALNNILGVSETEWRRIYSERETEWDKSIEKEIKNNEELKNSIPRIGMTREEVIITKWGRPNKVNKTTTSNGVSEQWVYDSDRYVYLDNGIVTAIQD